MPRNPCIRIGSGETIRSMKGHDASRHPGPWRVMRVDSELAGLIIAVGFLVMGFVSMPIATLFVLGAVALGVFVALVLRFVPKKYGRMVAAGAIILVAVVLFWEGRKPRRPNTVSSTALYVLADNGAFRLHNRGNWVDCWFDAQEKVNRCKLTDEQGAVLFEDVYLPCVGSDPIQQRVLVENGRRTWRVCLWRSPEKGTPVPVVDVYGQVLLPRGFYTEAKRDVYCSPH